MIRPSRRPRSAADSAADSISESVVDNGGINTARPPARCTSEIADADLPDGGFDLVSAFYPALRRTPDHRNERALLAAVKPGGELLMVHHETIDREQALAHGFDPDDYLGVSHVHELAGDDFEVVKSEVRIRTITGGRGIDYIDDAVLRLRRLS